MVAATHSTTDLTGSGEGGELPHLAMIPIAEITESASNPRTYFRGLEELADSIHSQGVLQPIRVRPGWDAGGRTVATDYELVFGARRLRAAQLAGLKMIPAIVGPMSDGQVAEAQLVENDQRDDVHPLEQARAYARVLEVSGRDVPWIAGKVGRSESYIFKALKLLDLGPKAQARWLDLGHAIPPSVAIHFARLPEDKQDEALSLAIEEAGEYALTSRTVGPWLRSRYFLRLADAPFDVQDRALVATAGACPTCPKNTAAAERLDLFDTPELRADAHCTDRACHKAKADAAWAAKKVEAESKDGPPIIVGKPGHGLAPRIAQAHADTLDAQARAELADLEVKGVSRGPLGQITEYVDKRAQERIVTQAGERLLKEHPESKSVREEKAPPVAVAAVALPPLREADFLRVELRRIFKDPSSKREGWVAEVDGYGVKSATTVGIAEALRSLALELDEVVAPTGKSWVVEEPAPKAKRKTSAPVQLDIEGGPLPPAPKAAPKPAKVKPKAPSKPKASPKAKPAKKGGKSK